jgi:hypothetical protein
MSQIRNDSKGKFQSSKRKYFSRTKWNRSAICAPRSRGATEPWLRPQIDSRHIKGGDRRHVGANVSILSQPSLHFLTRSEGCEIQSEGRCPWCSTAPAAAFTKAVPGQYQWRPEGLRTFTRRRHSSTPPTLAMVDDLALRHGKKLCSSSRLGPYT